MIAGHTGLSFTAFISNLAPIAFVSLWTATGALLLVFRRRLRIPERARERVGLLDARGAIEDPGELRRTGPLLLATIAAFFVHRPLGLEPATVALVGASAMLAASRQRIDRTLAGIDWATLFFFIGLFVIVGSLEATGAIARVADAIIAATSGDRTAELLAISWVAAIVGGIVDNIPLTATMIPVVDEIEAGRGDAAYWWALALGACFGGNLTIVSAAANVAAAGIAARERRPIGFVRFLRTGVPVTVGTMVLVTTYILLRYA
jgi:Na+/H+ antiporter NhaD/arsenite permease-like protein